MKIQAKIFMKLVESIFLSKVSKFKTGIPKNLLINLIKKGNY